MDDNPKQRRPAHNPLELPRCTRGAEILTKAASEHNVGKGKYNLQGYKSMNSVE